MSDYKIKPIKMLQIKVAEKITIKLIKIKFGQSTQDYYCCS